MAAITFTQIMNRRDALMRADQRVSVIVLRPDATDDTTVGCYLVKDPDPGDDPVTTTILPGNAKGGTLGAINPWKSFTYANLGTAYGLP